MVISKNKVNGVHVFAPWAPTEDTIGLFLATQKRVAAQSIEPSNGRIRFVIIPVMTAADKESLTLTFFNDIIELSRHII
jgi:hypothetical protein